MRFSSTFAWALPLAFLACKDKSKPADEQEPAGATQAAGAVGTGNAAGGSAVAGARVEKAERAPLWAVQLGSLGLDSAAGLALGAGDRVVVAGSTEASLGGPHLGANDMVVMGLSESGAVSFQTQLGTVVDDFAAGVVVDTAGDLLVAGYTLGDLATTNLGSNDAVLLKLSATGKLLWQVQFGTPESDYPKGLAVAADGSCVLAGPTQGELAAPVEGQDDIFVVKYSPKGEPLWAKQLGTVDYDNATDVAIDAQGAVWVAGYTVGSLAAASKGAIDGLLLKYSAAGDPLWQLQLGTSENDYMQGVAAAADGGAYLVGETLGEWGQPNAGGWDLALTKVDTKGQVVWKTLLGTPDDDYSSDVTVDAKGEVWVAGHTRGTLGARTFGAADLFVAHFTADGKLVGKEQQGSPGEEYVKALAVGSGGAAFVLGTTDGAFPGPLQGSLDLFVLRTP